MQSKLKHFTRQRVVTVLLCLLLAAAIAWGVIATLSSARFRRRLEAGYNKSFYNMADALSSVQVQLSKLMVSSAPAKNIELLSAISRQSDTAVSDLASLPLNDPTLTDAMAFFNVVSDYCRTLTREAGCGKPPSDHSLKTLMTLNNTCALLCSRLDELKAQGVTFELTGDTPSVSLSAGDITLSVQEGLETPHLIYDGPFSESIKGRTPLGLSPGETDAQGALGNAAVFLGVSPESLTVLSESNDGLPGYLISDADSQTAFVKVTRQGGSVQWSLTGQDEPCEARLSTDEVTEKARLFLARAGYGGLVLTWAQEYDGIYVMSFAAQQNGAICYSDLIKLRVRMDTGDVVGFDATGWLMNHRMRSLPTHLMDVSEAEALVSPQLTVTMRQLAYVPLPGGDEALCYGFTGTFGGDTFLVYIDAVTGDEVDIFKVIEVSEGAAVI